MTDKPAPPQSPGLREALKEIAAAARFEQEHPTEMRDTAFALIEKRALAALAAQSPVLPPSGVEGERERCAKVCEHWIETFKDRDIQFTSARDYAIDAINDIADVIRSGIDPYASLNTATLPPEE